mgnify:CR=1 FL=1
MKPIKIAGTVWIVTLIVLILLLLSPYNDQDTPPDFITIIFILDVLVGIVAFCCIFIFGFLHRTTKNTVKDTSVSEAKSAKLKSKVSLFSFLSKVHPLVYIAVILLFIAYRLYNPASDTPKTELDCLKLGSDQRAKECLELIRTPKDFPIFSLSLENINATTKNYCIEVSGTVKNSHSVPAQYILLRIDFTETQYGEPFHYETFSPFDSKGEQLQPNSKKTFAKCLRSQTFDAVKTVKDWYYSVTPFSAKIYERD